jgi:hypothetical protein
MLLSYVKCWRDNQWAQSSDNCQVRAIGLREQSNGEKPFPMVRNDLRKLVVVSHVRKCPHPNRLAWDWGRVGVAAGGLMRLGSGYLWRQGEGFPTVGLPLQLYVLTVICKLAPDVCITDRQTPSASNPTTGAPKSAAELPSAAAIQATTEARPQGSTTSERIGRLTPAEPWRQDQVHWTHVQIPLTYIDLHEFVWVCIDLCALYMVQGPGSVDPSPPLGITLELPPLWEICSFPSSLSHSSELRDWELDNDYRMWRSQTKYSHIIHNLVLFVKLLRAPRSQ